MKTKKLKGFTLIECIVALAVLAIASLVMAQIYASVAVTNRNNHIINTSLSQQMKYVEKQTNSEAISIYAGNSTAKDPSKVPNHARSADKINSLTIQSDLVNADIGFSSQKYSYAVDTFVLLSRDNDDKKSTDAGYNGVAEKDYQLRYKYMQGHGN